MDCDLPRTDLNLEHSSEEKPFVEIIKSDPRQNYVGDPIAQTANNDLGGGFYRYQSLITVSGTAPASGTSINQQTASQPFVSYIFIPREATSLEDEVNLQLEARKLSEEMEIRAE